MAGADASAAVSMAADDARFAILATRAVAATGSAWRGPCAAPRPRRGAARAPRPSRQTAAATPAAAASNFAGALRHRVLTPVAIRRSVAKPPLPLESDERERGLFTRWARAIARDAAVSLNVASRGKIWSLWRKARWRICRRAVACRRRALLLEAVVLGVGARPLRVGSGGGDRPLGGVRSPPRGGEIRRRRHPNEGSPRRGRLEQRGGRGGVEGDGGDELGVQTQDRQHELELVLLDRRLAAEDVEERRRVLVVDAREERLPRAAVGVGAAVHLGRAVAE